MGNNDMFRIATTAIIFNGEGKMLITKRAMHKTQWPGKWTVPGGGLETSDFLTTQPTHQGETDQWYGVILNALRREVLEETGLQVHRLWMVTDLAFIRQDGVPVIVLSYAGTTNGKTIFGDPEEVVYDVDTIDHAWVDLREARDYDLIEGIYSEMELASLEWGKRLVA